MRLESSPDEWRDETDDPVCERVALLISREIDGELAPADARDLRQHLAVCAACRCALDAQTRQSRLLNQNLRALWKTDDRAARQRQNSALTLRNRIRFKRRFSWPLTCLALAGGALFFTATVCAPGGSAPDSLRTPAVSADSRRLNVQPVHTAHVMPMGPIKLIDTKTVEAIAPSSPPPPNGTERALATDSSVDGLDEIEPEMAPEIRAATHSESALKPLASERIPAPVASSVHTVETMAMLSAPAAPRPLVGLALNYSARTALGARVAGHMTLLGDVLNGRAIVRVETDQREILEVRQSEVDTLLPEPHRAAARALIAECLSKEPRAKIEKMIQAASE